MVELAVVLTLFLILVMGMLEMAITVFRYHVVSQGARQAARLAIVHGELAPKGSGGLMTQWGPDTYQAADLSTANDEIATGVKQYLTGLPLDQTSLTLQWPDGDSNLESRVQVTVTTQYSPFVTFLFSDDWLLTATSTMRIHH
jgi:Flp pilus assembly protein TadG